MDSIMQSKRQSLKENGRSCVSNMKRLACQMKRSTSCTTTIGKISRKNGFTLFTRRNSEKPNMTTATVREDKSPLLKSFCRQSVGGIIMRQSTSTGWIEDITDERLAARLKELSQEDLELLTQFIIQGFTQSDLEQMGYGKQYKISRRISRLKKIFEKIIENCIKRVLAAYHMRGSF